MKRRRSGIHGSDPAGAPEPPGEARNRRLVVLAVAVLALLVRVGYELSIARDDGPVGVQSRVLLGDERAYDALARRVASGTLRRERAFYQEPLYGWLIGQVYRIAPPSPIAGTPAVVPRDGVHAGIFAAQHALGVATAVLVALLAMRCFSPRAGLMAGTLAALSGPLVFHEAMLLKEPLAIVVLCLLLHAWLSALERGGRALAAAVGVLAGVGILLRGNLYFLLALIVATLFWKRRIVEGLLVGVVALVVLSPVTIHNLRRGDRVLTTYQAGSNAAIGQPDDSRILEAALYAPLREGRGDALHEEDDAVAIAEAATGRRMTGREISAWWWARTWERIAKRPGIALARALVKAAHVFHGDEVPDVKDWRFFRVTVPWLATPLSDMRIVGPLALAGFLLLPWRRRADLLVVRGSVAVTILSFALFYVMGRYRLPAAPGLWILAAGLLDALPSWPRRRAIAAAAVAVVLVAAGFVPLRPGAGSSEASWTNHALVEIHLAEAELDPARAERRRDAAMRAARKALETAPENLDARVRLVRALDLSTPALAPRPAEALDEAWRLLLLAHARRTGTESVADLGAGASRVREKALALRALPAAPGGERVASVLAVASRRVAVGIEEAGERDLALELLDDAARLDPADGLTHLARGAVLKRAGRLDESEAAYRQALAAGLDTVELRNNLGGVLLALGRPVEALAEFERALEKAPGHPLILGNIEKARAAPPGPGPQAR